VFANPAMISVLLGLFYSLVFTSNGARYTNATGVHIKPAFLDNMIAWLASVVVPVAAFTIGLFAAKYYKGFGRHILRDVLYLLVKFLLVPMLAIAVLLWFGISNSEARIGVLINSLPLALVAFTVSEFYQCGSQAMTAQIVWGTVLMLPVLIAWDQFMDAVGLFGSDPWRL
jgi:predicted permease